MSASVRNLFALFTGLWPRVAGFADTPSLLALALIANLVALIPAFRPQKETLPCPAGTLACEQSTSPGLSGD